MAALGELTGHEVVAGVEAGQAGEVGERRVGGQNEDEHRSGLEAVVEDVAHGPAAEHDLADLGDHRRRALLVGRHVHVGGQPRQPEEHDTEQRSHDHERCAGVLPGGLTERGDAVRDRLDAGDSCAAGGKSVQDDRQ